VQHATGKLQNNAALTGKSDTIFHYRKLPAPHQDPYAPGKAGDFTLLCWPLCVTELQAGKRF
jgi:hypothetical protein